MECYMETLALMQHFGKTKIPIKYLIWAHSKAHDLYLTTPVGSAIVMGICEFWKCRLLKKTNLSH